MQRREYVSLTWITLAAFLGGAVLGLARPHVADALAPEASPGVVPSAPLEIAPSPALPRPPAEPPATMVTMFA